MYRRLGLRVTTAAAGFAVVQTEKQQVSLQLEGPPLLRSPLQEQEPAAVTGNVSRQPNPSMARVNTAGLQSTAAAGGDAGATALPKTAAKARMVTNLQEQEQAAAAGNGGRQQRAAGMQGQAPVGGGAGREQQSSQTDTQILEPLAREVERFEREEVSSQHRKLTQQPLPAVSRPKGGIEKLYQAGLRQKRRQANKLRLLEWELAQQEFDAATQQMQWAAATESRLGAATMQ